MRFDAAADLRTLARLIPAQSRLVLDAPSQQQGPAANHEPDSVSVPTSSVRAGDLLRVLPGERIPVDGEVLQGRCSVDESMLTGESVLVPKQAGAQVRCLPSAAVGGCGRAHAACGLNVSVHATSWHRDLHTLPGLLSDALPACLALPAPFPQQWQSAI